MAAKLDHPNIVSIIEVGELQSRTPYLVMRLVEGDNLAAQMPEFGAAPRRERRGSVPGSDKHCRALCRPWRGLSICPYAGVLHRDLKPSNILLDPRPAASDRFWDRQIARPGNGPDPNR